MLSNEAVQEYKKIHKEVFGEEISDETALEDGINLLTMFNKIYRPVKREWYDEFTSKEKLQN